MTIKKVISQPLRRYFNMYKFIQQRILFLALASLFFGGCKQITHNVTVNAEITGAAGSKVTLEQLSASGISLIVDSTTVNSNNKFTLSCIVPEPGLYRIHFGAQKKYIIVSLEKGNVDVKADFNRIEQYTVEGSESSENIRTFFSGLRPYIGDINTLNVVIDSMKARGKDSMATIAANQRNEVHNKMTDYVKKFADSTPYEPNAIFAAHWLNFATEADFMEHLSKSLAKKFPNTKLTKDFGEYYNKMMANITKTAPVMGHVDVGSFAPEATFTDTSGKTFTLSSLKGKIVLIQFWAAWNKKSSDVNPSLVALYEKYKNKDFTIVSVSLDNKRADWIKGINDGKLSWLQSSDLKGMNSDLAHQFGVDAIPYSFLLDDNGKVIGRDVNADVVETMIKAILK